MSELRTVPRDTDDEAMSEGDEDDPALLSELEGLSGGGHSSQAPTRRQQQQQPPVEPLVYASANLTAVIDERIANYTQVRLNGEKFRAVGEDYKVNDGGQFE